MNPTLDLMLPAVNPAPVRKSFEESADEQDGIEYWPARDLQFLLEYEAG